MQTFKPALTLFAVALYLANVHAQQTPPAKTDQPASPKASSAAASKTTKAGPAKSAVAAKPALVLKTQKDKFSYALGMNIATGMRSQSVEIDPNIVAQGMKAVLTGGATLMTPEQVQAALLETRNEVQKHMQEKMEAQGAANKQEGEAFLAANKSKEGVVTLPSGLQYKILKAGTG